MKKILDFLLAFSLSTTVFAAPTALPVADLDASLEEELNWLQAESIVFSVARNEQRVSNAAAAVFVINQQDIKRSGVTSVPEALRMVPGLQVAKLNANVWAISSRGFNRADSNKLLVMIDGRTVYHPVFSGTLWRTKDVMLEDVDHIEVIRGPGATMWGSNAVNGVIHVITKKAEDTQGLLATAGGGSEERAFGSMRYGGNWNGNLNYRAYIKYAKRDDSKRQWGGDGNDEWENIQGGFRIDAELTDNDLVTLQGDTYHGNAGSVKNIASPLPPNSGITQQSDDFAGGNVLARWTHNFSSTANSVLQLYFDQTEDKSDYPANDLIKVLVRTYDADFQNQFQLQPWQHITWGLGVRYVTSDANNAVNFSFSPHRRDSFLYSAFLQDELSLVPDRLKFVLGSKFEYNDFSGFEFQPSARIIFTPDEKQSFWASVSRAVRIPNRLDHDLQNIYLSQLAPGAFVTGQGNRHIDSEQLIAYELGYRLQPNDSLSFDIAAFYNDYDKLITPEVGSATLLTTPQPHIVVPIFGDNKGTGETYGIEVMTQWKALNWWRLQASYSYLQIQLHARGRSRAVLPDAAEGDSPHHQFNLRSSMDLFNNIHLDTTVRYVDSLPNQNVRSYTEMDVRLAWTPIKNIELSVVGQNLLDKQHAESNSGLFAVPMEVQRSFYGKISWQY